MEKGSKIYVAGHTGMVGSAIMRRLEKEKYTNVIGKRHSELDLTRQEAVEGFFREERPDVVFFVAANVGGISDNRAYPAEHLIDNTYMELNVIRSAFSCGCRKLLFVSSNSIYPMNTPSPQEEGNLMGGILEPDWEGYGISKIVGVKLCEYYRRQYGVQYISAVPCNLYGINDCYDLGKARVVAALIRRFHEAKRDGSEAVEIWGDGTALREFLFADDLAEACLFLMDSNVQDDIINVSPGIETSIRDIAYMVKEVVGYGGRVLFNADKPGGIPRKSMSCERIRGLGWEADTSLEDGIRIAYSHFKEKYD